MTNSIHKQNLNPAKVATNQADIWLVISSVADLCKISQQAIRKSCKEREGRYTGGRYIFRLGHGNGGQQYEILISSLPREAQAKYWVDSHKATTSILPISNQLQTQEQVTHAEYEQAWETYNRKCDSIKTEARRRVDILDETLVLLKGGLNQQFILNMLNEKYSGISRSTLWRWKESVEGHPRLYWESILAPDYKGRSRVEIHHQAWAFFVHYYGQQSQPSAAVIYRETKLAAAKNDWGALPSCKTFIYRYKSDLSENAKILARKGKTALKESLPHLKRDFTTLEIHELWESDGRLGDVICKWPDGTVARPWIVIIRDVRSRMPVGIKLYTTTNAELVIDAFRNAVMMSETTPIGFHLDNGTEYSNNVFTGGQKSSVRFAVKKDQPIGLLTRMGIKVKWATPYHGAAKAIESFWNIIAEYVDKTFQKAYTGRNPVERPENWDKRHAVPIEDYSSRLLSVIEAWAKGDLGAHRGQGMDGKCPLDLYSELILGHLKRPATAEHLRSMRPLVFKRILSRQRVFQLTLSGFGQVEYEPSDDLEIKIGFTYEILPDPADPKAPALIYEGLRYIGDANYKNHTPYLHETAGQDITKRRSAIIKKVGRQLKVFEHLANGTPKISQLPSIGLPALLQPQLLNVLKLPKEVPAESPITVIELENGDLMDTETGVVTPYIQLETPQTTIDLEDEALELVRLAKAQRQKYQLP